MCSAPQSPRGTQGSAVLHLLHIRIIQSQFICLSGVQFRDAGKGHVPKA